jgi:V8-like Glu-specific endopeptidase
VFVLVVTPSAGAIVYGQPDGNRHPNVGTLVAEIEGEKQSICSGTLIAPRVFLTASHCTDFVQQALGTSGVWVSFDPVFSETSTLIPGTAHTNPAYNRFQGPGGHADPGDIAVVVLAQAVGATPAQLPTAGLLDQLKAAHQLNGQTFTAVGYGAVRETRKG